ncbi:unnamed protein product [Moneuplotes crassus]|uniref:Uncharacterized protein n=1 Tax=Euplotes crassus TaxID=5936 RepID=A0AAD1XD59_EUPCR|nr:unnamed protein product [Moneuplotes crassus]
MLVKLSPKHPSGSYSRAGKRIRNFTIKNKPKVAKSKPISEDDSETSFQDDYIGILQGDYDANEQNLQEEFDLHETRKERRKRLKREELKHCSPAFKSIPRDIQLSHNQSPDLGKYSPNYDVTKPIRVTNFGKGSVRNTATHFFKGEDRRSEVCGRLMRSMKNRKSRVEIINKIFRKRKPGTLCIFIIIDGYKNDPRFYKFSEKHINDGLKNIYGKHKPKDERNTIDELTKQGILDLHTNNDYANNAFKMKQMKRLTTQSFELLSPMKIGRKTKGGDLTTKAPNCSNLLSQNMRIRNPASASINFYEKENQKSLESANLKRSFQKSNNSIKKHHQSDKKKKNKSPKKLTLKKGIRVCSQVSRDHVQSVMMAKQSMRDTNSFLEIPTYCANDYNVKLDTVMGKLNKGMINFKKQTKRGDYHSFYKRSSAPEQYNCESISSAYDKIGYIGSNVAKAKLTFG